MKIRKLFFGMIAAASVLASCQEKEENLGAPEITLDPATLEFGQQGGDANSKTLTVTSTRDWTIEQDEKDEWVTISPSSGSASSEPQTVTVTVTDNTSSDRTATIKFTAVNGTVSKNLTVKQTGPEGSVEETYVYFNDFDKEAAQKGDNGWDTYLDTFEGWRNEMGTGINSVTYESSGASVRTLSMDSASGMSLYEGSGVNNVFFGKNAYFQIGNLTLDPEALNYTLSFGSERYGKDDPDNTFNHDEFQVYISNDGSKWVEIEYTFAQGSDPVGKWDLASSTFTVPSGTSELYIYFNVTAASVYRIDDLKLATSSEAGVNIDFSQGGEIGGGDTSEIKDITIKDFLETETDDQLYRLTGTLTYVQSFNYGNVYIEDETGSVLAYGLCSDENLTFQSYKEIEGLGVGDIVTIVGKHEIYDGQQEVTDCYYESHRDAIIDPTITEKTVNDFIAAEVSYSPSDYYRLSGTIIEIDDEKAGNLTIQDATGDVYIYNLAADKNFVFQSFGTLGLKVGDVITIAGCRGEHNGTPQMVNCFFESKDENALTFTVSPLSLSFGASGESKIFSINSNVDWTVTSSDPDNFKVSDASGNGSKDITVTATENTTGAVREATVTVSTTAEVATKSYEIKITQSAPASGDVKHYVKITSAPADWSGQYLIVYEGEDGALAFDGSLETLDAVNDYKEVSIEADAIESNTETDALSFTIESVSSGYNIRSASGYYIYQTSDANGLKSSTSVPDDVNTITYDSTDGCKIECNSAVLRFNNTSNQMRFRYYKSSTYSNQKPVALYKLSE